MKNNPIDIFFIVSDFSYNNLSSIFVLLTTFSLILTLHQATSVVYRGPLVFAKSHIGNFAIPIHGRGIQGIEGLNIVPRSHL